MGNIEQKHDVIKTLDLNWGREHYLYIIFSHTKYY